MMQSYTKCLAFLCVVVVFVSVCARASEARTCNREELIGLRARFLDVYGLENLTTVTKINLRAHYVCVLIMSDPWLSCWHEETRVLATT